LNIAISERSSRVWSSVAYSFIWEGENVWLELTPTMDACMDRHTDRQAGRQAGKTLLNQGRLTATSGSWERGRGQGRAGQVKTGYWYCVRIAGFAGISIARICTGGVVMAQVSRTCI
jgi:hypothetical protein